MAKAVRVMLVGDVMLGRGVDQILYFPSDPKIYESCMKDARGYVEIAVRKNGNLPANRSLDYVWGELININKIMSPDFKVINLETAVTSSGTPWPRKGINYRMHPRNIDVIKAAEIDCCMLANNHVLDWQVPGLIESIDTLTKNDIQTTGAGKNVVEAQCPAIFNINANQRILVFGIGHESSGVFTSWAAGTDKPGVYYLAIESRSAVKDMTKLIKSHKRDGDIVMLSVHWGGNWGYEVEAVQKQFAHDVIDSGTVDLVHGHSSHHVKGLEVYKGKLILYGCGDFLNDYEGISAPDYNTYRDDLSCAYYADIDRSTGRLKDLFLIPTQIKKIRIEKPSVSDADWLRNVLCREYAKFGCSVVPWHKNTCAGFQLIM